jgi:hypothetical protein
MRRLLLALAVSGCAQVDNPFIGDDGGLGGGSTSNGGGTASSGGGTASNGGGTASNGGGTASSGGGTASSGGGTASTGGGTGACTPDWSCTGWQLDNTGTMATRSCLDNNFCGTTAGKPNEGPAAVPALDKNYYRCNVQPIVDATCSMMGCHGTDTGRDYRVYSRGRWRNKEMVYGAPTCPNSGAMYDLQTEGSGTIMCLGWSRLTATEWQKNYDNARLFAVDLTDTSQSLLLLEPSSTTYYAHDGIKVFTGTDARYTTVKAWLDGATAPATCDGGMN